MPSHHTPIHGLPDTHRSPVAPSLPFSLTKTALLTALMFTASLLSGTPCAATINNGNLTSTFGNGSANLDLENNGTITVSPKSASKGSTVTITVKPDAGYELDTLSVLDKNGDRV